MKRERKPCGDPGRGGSKCQGPGARQALWVSEPRARRVKTKGEKDPHQASSSSETLSIFGDISVSCSRVKLGASLTPKHSPGPREGKKKLHR